MNSYFQYVCFVYIGIAKRWKVGLLDSLTTQVDGCREYIKDEVLLSPMTTTPVQTEMSIGKATTKTPQISAMTTNNGPTYDGNLE